MGPYARNISTSEVAIHAEIPVFDNAVDMGIMAAISTMLSHPIILYAASTLRTQRVRTISSPAMITTATGLMPSWSANTMQSTMSNIKPAARGALWSSATLSASAVGEPITIHSRFFFAMLSMPFHSPCTNIISPFLTVESSALSNMYLP